MLIKKIVLVIAVVLFIFQLTGCGSKTASEVTIEYGHSELYSQEDMNAAIQLIEEEFNNWDGCELHSITYSSDEECNADNIAWMNDLEEANDAKETLTQCIMFTSDFHSPKKGGGVWNADREYTGW